MTKNNQPVVPALRFKEFKREWKRFRLQEVTDKIQDGTHFSPNSSDTGDYKYITSKNIRTGYLSLSNIEYISKLEHDRIYKRCNVKFGDILLTKDGASTGNACLNTLREEFSLLSSVAFIRTNADHSNEFVYQWVVSPRGQKEIRISISGQAITRITLSKLRNYKPYLPTLPEQQKIATFLTAVDTKIQQLREKQDLLKQYKKGVMQRIFSQEIRFKREDGTDFGKWEEKKLGEVTILFSNRNKKLIDAPIYSVTNYDGFVLQAEHFDKEVAGSDLTNYKIVKKGDFAYNPARINVGSIAYFNEETGIISSLYVCFRTKKELSNEFLLNFLELDYTKYQIDIYGEGGVRVYLWYPLFSNIKINLPTLEEQQKITTFLTQLDKKINQVGQQLEEIQAYKKGLLQQMFV